MSNMHTFFLFQLVLYKIQFLAQFCGTAELNTVIKRTSLHPSSVHKTRFHGNRLSCMN